MHLALLSLLAGPGAQAAAPGKPGAAVPLYALSDSCQDDRFPRLAGPFVVGCGKGGRVDTILSLETGEVWELDVGLDHATTGPSALYAPGQDGGFWHLTASGPQAFEDLAVIREPPFGMAATDGEHVVFLGVEHLQAFNLEERARRLIPTRAAGWEGAALAWPTVAWTVVRDDGTHQVMRLEAGGADESRRITQGTGPQRLVVGQGRHLAWVEGTDLVIFDLEASTERHISARTGFQAPPTLWQGEACWESREEGGEIDLRCSDGLHLERPGDQLWPSRWGPWLLFQEDGTAWLYTWEQT